MLAGNRSTKLPSLGFSKNVLRIREYSGVYGSRSEEEFGGADRDRTGGLVVANDALSQLSYSPT
jgi:hypothetical protein